MKTMRSWTTLFLGVATLVSVVAQQGRAPSADHLRNKLSGVQKERSALRGELRKTESQARSVLQDIREVDRDMASLETSLAMTQARLREYRVRQREMAERLARTEEELDGKRAQLRLRLRALSVQPRTDPLLALVTVADVGELASRGVVMQRIAEQDRRLMDAVADLVREAAEQKSKQDALVGQVADLEWRQTSEQGRLEGARAQKKATLGSLRARQDRLRAELDQLDRESAQLAAQIRALQAQRRVSHGSSTAPGSLSMPVSGSITSSFGMRYHPILGQRRMHNGIDFGAPTGTPIRAAADGTVIAAQYMSGYGNTVVVDHGGDLSTLYAHCSRLLVSVGQRVSRGEVIAAVGSTGLSTGPHLHFEVRIDGQPVDPRSRL